MKSLWSSQNDRLKSVLIVGLGNPGKEYDQTRHNIGCETVKSLAKSWDLEFKKERSVHGFVAKKKDDTTQILFLLPTTYMNLSGTAVLACMRAFKIPLERIIIVSDDKDLEFGVVRLRKKGSSGGHNGLKSVELQLGTQEFSRLKVGIGAPAPGEVLAHYVLERFTQEEKASLPKILEEARRMLDLWIKENR